MASEKTKSKNVKAYNKDFDIIKATRNPNGSLEKDEPIPEKDKPYSHGKPLTKAEKRKRSPKLQKQHVAKTRRTLPRYVA